MSGNTFGKLFTVTTFGESHGPALGAIVDGCPPGLALSEADLQRDLDRRRPGSSRHTTQRREPDQVKILSGVFEGRTTGTPIGLAIENPTSAPRTTPRSRRSSAPRMPTTPITTSTAFATTAAAAVPARVRPRCASLPGPSPRPGWRSRACACAAT